MKHADPVRLDGKVVLVTGGANGIGLATARLSARRGATVVLLDRDAAALDDADMEDVQAAQRHALDVADEAQVTAVMQDIARSLGRIDVLVNNAGIAIRHETVSLSRADWDKVMAVNVTGMFLCAREAARCMLANRTAGAIVNTASIMGLSGGGIYPNISYQTSKGAVVNFTRALAVEWAPHGIRVNAVAPTWVETQFIKPLLQQPEIMARIRAMTPLGRMARPDEVAAAIVFLASPAASMVTGHTLAVDGGFLAQ